MNFMKKKGNKMITKKENRSWVLHYAHLTAKITLSLAHHRITTEQYDRYTDRVYRALMNKMNYNGFKEETL